MRNMQDKFLNAVNEISKDYQLDFVVSHGASNTGNGYIQDGFKNVLIFEFNFQRSYCSITFFHGHNPKLEVKSMSCGYLEYSNSSKVKQFFELINEYLEEYDTEKYMEAE